MEKNINNFLGVSMEKIKQMVALFEEVHRQNPMPIRF